MRVLHLAAGSLSRGASRGALWLHQGLLDQGVESRLLTTDPQPTGRSVQAVQPGRQGQLRLWCLKQLDRLPLRLYRFDRAGTLSPGCVGLPVQDLPGYEEADVIHLHWINDGLLDLKSLQRCSKPIVWTVRDLWPVTGLCHYPQGCLRRAEGCGRCPLLPWPRWPWSDPSRRGYRRKQRWLATAPITYVGISPWVAGQLQASPITANRPVEMIWNCIDTTRFRPIQKQEARDVLGLDPLGGPYLLAEWRSPQSEPWKGFQRIVEILPALKSMGCTLLLFGSVPLELLPMAGEPGVQNLGRISDDARLRLIYAAADLFLCPTLEEAFGKTMAESMACGTPVVAFRSSSPADLVEPGLTGVLAASLQSGSFLQAVSEALMQTEKLSAHCAARARQRFSQTVAASAYQDLYGRLCPSSPARLQQA